MITAEQARAKNAAESTLYYSRRTAFFAANGTVTVTVNIGHAAEREYVATAAAMGVGIVGLGRGYSEQEAVTNCLTSCAKTAGHDVRHIGDPKHVNVWGRQYTQAEWAAIATEMAAEHVGQVYPGGQDKFL